jgi:hypothetical protein
VALWVNSSFFQFYNCRKSECLCIFDICIIYINKRVYFQAYV